jgi:hypothetical protein
VSPDKRLRLQASWRYFRTSEGLELTSLVSRQRIRLTGTAVKDADAVLDCLSRGVAAEDPAARLREATGASQGLVQRILSLLESKGALVVTRDDEAEATDSRFHRQILFFNGFERSDADGAEMNRRLQERTVAIVGLGGYGCWLALLCAQIGIRRIVGIDPDVVECSNLSRQVLYVPQDIGRLKVDACRDALQRSAANLEFEGHVKSIQSEHDLAPLLAGADLVFNGFGYLGREQAGNSVLGHVARAALLAGVPSLVFGGSWIGPLTIPQETACYWCLLRNDVAGTLLGSVMQASAPPPGARFNPNFAPRIALTASQTVWEASRFLSGMNRTPALDGVVVLDTFAYQRHQLIPVGIDPRCDVCGRP